MNIDFSLVLLVLSGLTGAVWLVDAVFFSGIRLKKVTALLAAGNKDVDQFRDYLQALDDSGQAGEEAKQDKAHHQLMDQAYKLYRDPISVEYAKSFFPVLFAVLLLRSFLFEPFQIPTTSMVPTLNAGDFIVVNKFSYGVRLPVIGTKVLDVDEPERGDVMVFIPPHRPDYFIKRVIGLPGDHVQYRDKTVFINGEALVQDNAELIREQGVIHATESIGELNHDIYTMPSRPLRSYPSMPPEGIVVPEGHYFMMGDNRDNSEDSRYWGTVSEDSIVGKAVAVWMHKEPGLKLPSFGQNRLIENP